MARRAMPHPLDSRARLISTAAVPDLRPAALRRFVAAVLILAFTLAGVGRGFSAGSDGSARAFGITGAAVHICHAGDGSVPADPTRHGCCDACALCLAAVVPTAPSETGSASAERVVGQARIFAWAPVVARSRTPRLSQGPPAA